ncbi:Oxidoreductase NAD-binding domain-containing protein 1 [Mactra antiquata]
MASDHLGRTAENTRLEVISLATVIGIRDESKTVKSLSLKVQDERLTFKSGQWVDMFIPGLETVGGFSMCSSPIKLKQEQVLDLAVKYSKHPPAYWVHTKCKEGDTVDIRVGGDFYFDPMYNNKDVDLLLIAGGVGINPLYSIVNEIVDINKGDYSNHNKFSGRVTLLYSAQTKKELIFQEQLSDIQENNENIRCQFHVTREDNLPIEITKIPIVGKRIDEDVLVQCFDWLRKSNTLVYICGPFTMLEDMENTLIKIGINETNIKYEKWW